MPDKKKKNKSKYDTTLAIKGTLDDVLKASIPEKEKERTKK